MKASDYIKILKLAQTTLKEYENWGEYEMPKDKNAAKSLPAEGIVASKKSKKTLNTVEAFKAEICNCQKCPLGKSRLNFVFGEGNPNADIMFIGEGPGYQEDHEGRPFIGRAGQLLTKIIEAMGLKREDVFIANIVKCHPMKDPSDPELRANDRPPTQEEMDACKPYLDKQIDLIKPKVLCTLGSSSTKALLNSEESISTIRGNFKEYQNIKLMPTYHPAALLRNPNLKKFVWDDMKQILSFIKTGKI